MCQGTCVSPTEADQHTKCDSRTDRGTDGWTDKQMDRPTADREVIPSWKPAYKRDTTSGWLCNFP